MRIANLSSVSLLVNSTHRYLLPCVNHFVFYKAWSLNECYVKTRPTYCSLLKIKFHVTDTDTDTDKDFLADLGVRGSRRGLPRRAPRQSACHDARGRPTAGARGSFSSPRAGHRQTTCPRTFVRRAFFLARMSVGDARVYTCTCTDYCT